MRDDAEIESAIVDAIVAGTTPVSSLPNDELIVALDELAARRRRIDAALVAMAGEVAARSDGLPAEDSLVRAAGHKTVREMLQHRIGVRSREANVLCAVADATRARVALSGGDVPARFPHVGAAVAAGWIAVAQAHAIVETLGDASARIHVDDLEIAERSLVEHACGTSPDDVAPMVPEALAPLARRWIDHLDPDGDEPRYEEQLAQRYLRMRVRRDGMVRGEFLAMPEQGEAIAAVLDAEVAPRRATFTQDCGAHEEPRSDAAGTDESDAGAPVDDRSRDQRLIDALVAMAAHHAATGAPRVHDEAPTLTITVSEDALHGRPATLADVPRLERTGEPVPMSVAASLLCDAFVQTIVHDADGEPLRQGRKQRLFTKSQRRAIIARDEHCRAPGCTAPPGWCEAHHVEWWSRGGPTDVDNGLLLCRYHHTEVHRGTLTIEREAPGAGRRWRVAAGYPRRARTRPPLRR